MVTKHGVVYKSFSFDHHPSACPFNSESLNSLECPASADHVLLKNASNGGKTTHL